MYVCRSEDGLAAAQRAYQEMSENLRRVTQDKQSFDLKTAAELDDLYRTKINLEERLVELIRYKLMLRLSLLFFFCLFVRFKYAHSRVETWFLDLLPDVFWFVFSNG